jgi:hypothetical protein
MTSDLRITRLEAELSSMKLRYEQELWRIRMKLLLTECTWWFGVFLTVAFGLFFLLVKATGVA